MNRSSARSSEARDRRRVSDGSDHDLSRPDDRVRDDRAHPHIEEAFALGGDATRITSYYDEWVATYDDDVGGEYGLPASCVETLRRCAQIVPGIAPDDDPVVLDAGCGTGLIGVALAAVGYRRIDGVDLSPGMIEAARARGVYRELVAPVDLADPPRDGWRQRSQVVVVGGVYTLGHLRPDTLGEIVHWVRPGGVLIVSVRPQYYDSEPYQQVSDALVRAGVIDEIVRLVDAPYTADSSGHYFGYHLPDRVTAVV